MCSAILRLSISITSKSLIKIEIKGLSSSQRLSHRRNKKSRGKCFSRVMTDGFAV